MNAAAPTVESASIEPLQATIRISPDPTGTNPEFSVTSVDEESPGVTWVDGSWQSTWSQQTKRIVAHSATVGATGADFETVEGELYKMWMRFGTAIKLWGIFRMR